MILKIAIRNLFRQRRRTVITALSMGGGYVLLSLSLGLAEGSYNTIIDVFTRSQIGHLQLQNSRYQKRPSVHNTIDDLEKAARLLSEVPELQSFSPQVLSPALAFVGSRTLPVEVVGVDPEMENRTTKLEDRLLKGKYLDGEEPGVLVDESVSVLLKADIGDELVLITEGADGSIANDLFSVRGIIRGEKSAFGSRFVYVRAEQAQGFLSLGDRYHKIVVRLNHPGQAREVAARIEPRAQTEGWAALPWQVVASEFYRAMELDKNGNYVTLFIIVLIVSLGVLNTVLMNVLERTREFGVMKAIGTRGSVLFQVILTETFFLSLFSSFAGGIVSWGLNSYFATRGMQLPDPVSFAGIQFQTMYSEVSFTTIGMPALVTIGTALLVSIPPAIRAVRIRPVEALHAT